MSRGLWQDMEMRGTRGTLMDEFVNLGTTPTKTIDKDVIIVCLECEGRVNPTDTHTFVTDFGDIKEGTIGIHCTNCGYIPEEWTEELTKEEYLKRFGLKERSP